MKALQDLATVQANLTKEVSALYSRNEDLTRQIEAIKLATREASVALVQKARQRAEVKHAATVQALKVRASEYKTKMGQYQRDLAALRSIVRKEKH